MYKEQDNKTIEYPDPIDLSDSSSDQDNDKYNNLKNKYNKQEDIDDSEKNESSSIIFEYGIDKTQNEKIENDDILDQETELKYEDINFTINSKYFSTEQLKEKFVKECHSNMQKSDKNITKSIFDENISDIVKHLPYEYSNDLNQIHLKNNCTNIFINDIGYNKYTYLLEYFFKCTLHYTLTNLLYINQYMKNNDYKKYEQSTDDDALLFKVILKEKENIIKKYNDLKNIYMEQHFFNKKYNRYYVTYCNINNDFYIDISFYDIITMLNKVNNILVLFNFNQYFSNLLHHILKINNNNIPLYLLRELLQRNALFITNKKINSNIISTILKNFNINIDKTFKLTGNDYQVLENKDIICQINDLYSYNFISLLYKAQYKLLEKKDELSITLNRFTNSGYFNKIVLYILATSNYNIFDNAKIGFIYDNFIFQNTIKINIDNIYIVADIVFDDKIQNNNKIQNEIEKKITENRNVILDKINYKINEINKIISKQNGKQKKNKNIDILKVYTLLDCIFAYCTKDKDDFVQRNAVTIQEIKTKLTNLKLIQEKQLQEKQLTSSKN